jgi:hypothetical protein
MTLVASKSRPFVSSFRNLNAVLINTFGRAGQPVSIRLKRGDETMDITLVRASRADMYRK